ncbi:MAG: hypothetical protein WC107_07645 [Patescibacteria group bacterium]
MTGFQKQVNLTPAPAVAGDFASANPRATVLAGPGGLVAGAGGVTVGKFAWVDDDGATVISHGTATKAPDGFVHREQQALIANYLAESGNNVPAGFPVTLHNAGDFWAKLTGANAAAIGSAIYADYATGDVTAVAASTGASATGLMGATFTASGSGTDLTVTAVTGLITAGETLGTTTGITAGTTIVSQTSGTPGGAGVYVTSAATTISAATATSFGNTLKISAVASGSLAVGDPVSGSGIPSGTVIASQVSGTAGGVGVYTLDQSATAYAASTAITVVAGVLTGFKAKSVASVGELVKISTWG